MIRVFKRFFDFCGGENKKKFLSSVLLGVLSAMTEAMKITAIGVMLRALADNAVTTKTIVTCLCIMLTSIALSSMIKYRATMLQTEAGYGAAAGKRIEIAEHLRYLPMGYFNAHSIGEITSVTTNTMENISDIGTRVVMLVLQGVLTSAAITAMMLVFDIRIGLISCAGILLFFLVNACMQERAKTVSSKKIESDTRVVERILEYIHGIAEVKAYRLTAKSLMALDQAITDNADVNTEMEYTFIPFTLLQGLVTKLTGVAICLAALHFYFAGTMELVTCMMMLICAFMVFSHLENAGNYSALLRAIDLCVGRASGILALKPMDIEGEDIQTKTQTIDAEEIAFSYDTRKIIDDISLSIPEGSTAAFVGPSGGGKTTLVHLIARFWDVDEGCIKLDEKDVRTYSMDSLMSHFSFVFQSVYLFRDTIANNIRFGQPDAPLERVVEAAKKACCHDFIMALPDGYDTMIVEGGASLSGGEKQRISIARAILKDAPVIILDEATANVDPENEKELMEAIDALTREKTVLMIAHRLKTVQNADRIFVVDRGRITQRGTHAELMQEDGIYRRFVDARKQAVSWKL